jgi:hypothetical protein
MGTEYDAKKVPPSQTAFQYAKYLIDEVEIYFQCDPSSPRRLISAKIFASDFLRSSLSALLRSAFLLPNDSHQLLYFRFCTAWW